MSISSITRYLRRAWALPAPLAMGGAAFLLGLMTAAGIWLFKGAIALVQRGAWAGVETVQPLLGRWAVLLLPVLGGLLVGLASHFLLGEERYHGVAGIIEAVALAGGRLRYWRTPLKALLAALSIGSGASVGPEDPSVQIGAGLGSMLGQRLRFSDERVQALVGAGAAAGIAAAFNAPIAGVFFALEILLGEISGSALGFILLAAVASAVLTQAISGPQPAFAVPVYSFRSARELPFYFGLGLATGPISAAYIRLLFGARDGFAHWAAPRWLKTVVAGLAVGAVGVFLPQVMGGRLPDGGESSAGGDDAPGAAGGVAGSQTGPDARQARTVGDLCTRQLVVAYPDETLDVALRRMSERDVGRPPVVDRRDPRRLVGLLRRVDVTRAYHIVVARRTALRHRAQEARLGAVSGAQVEEIRVELGAPCAGRPVREIGWPRDALIAAVRQGNRVLIPRGDTVLLPGDVLTVVAESESADALRALCAPQSHPEIGAGK